MSTGTIRRLAKLEQSAPGLRNRPVLAATDQIEADRLAADQLRAVTFITGGPRAPGGLQT